MSLSSLQKHHYFKCFPIAHETQIDKDCYTGQEVKALGIKVSLQSSASSCVIQHSKSCPAVLTVHNQGPEAMMGDAHLTQGCREQPKTQGARCT